MRKLPIALLLLLLLPLDGCRNRETGSAEPESFAFVVYPGARYLAPLTELTKRAHTVLAPNVEPPATAIYDTDAPVTKVAEYYAKEYGYPSVAPDATNNLSSGKPQAYYRSGDLNTDALAAKAIADKLGLHVDYSKAQGKYMAAEIQAKPNRPRVTVVRPYFDMSTSQTVDRTMVLMSR